MKTVHERSMCILWVALITKKKKQEILCFCVKEFMCCRYFLLAYGEIRAVICEVLVVLGTYNIRGIIGNRCVNISFK